MKFICIKKHFDGSRLWEIGDKRANADDISKPTVKGEGEEKREVPSFWKRIDKSDPVPMKNIPEKELGKMKNGDLIIYAHNRWGVSIEGNKKALISQILDIEKAESQKKRTGAV